MGIESLRWWHWMIISICVGALLSFSFSGPVDKVSLPDAGQIQFEPDIEHPPVVTASGSTPWVNDLLVYPPVNLIDAAGNALQVQGVTYKVLVQNPKDPKRFVYTPRWFSARIPYIPSMQAERKSNQRQALNAKKLPPYIEQLYYPEPTDTPKSIAQAVWHHATLQDQEALRYANEDFRKAESVGDIYKLAKHDIQPGDPILIPWNPATNKTVMDWLNMEKATEPWLKYQFAWWKLPRNTWSLFMGGSFLVVGIITPIVLSLLSSIGLGPVPKSNKEMDLSRFGKRPSVAAKIAPTNAVTQDDLDQLRKFEDQVRANLTDGSPTPTQMATIAPSTPQPVAIKADPLAPPAATDEAHLVKEYGGEFYPVVRSIHPDDENAQGDSTDASKPPNA